MNRRVGSRQLKQSVPDSILLLEKEAGIYHLGYARFY